MVLLGALAFETRRFKEDVSLTPHAAAPWFQLVLGEVCQGLTLAKPEPLSFDLDKKEPMSLDLAPYCNTSYLYLPLGGISLWDTRCSVHRAKANSWREVKTPAHVEVVLTDLSSS